MYISVFCGAMFSAALSKVHWTFFTPERGENARMDGKTYTNDEVFFNKSDYGDHKIGDTITIVVSKKNPEAGRYIEHNWLYGGKKR